MPELTEHTSKYAALPGRAARLLLSRPGSALLAARMGAWVVAVSLLLKVCPLPRAMRLVSPRMRRRALRPSDAAEVQARLARLLDSVLAADFWVFTPTCWKRAPVLHRYLALEGVETRVLFGVRRGVGGGDALSGHAWLEAEGKPLLEDTPPDYTVTYSYPPE
ncbi:MAG: lasso peptide biosynthesis B2 protein [Acidobacteria bacterium]|nr:lasso peptide biosynthesis B2 protein [Acidobacteriota bacterium]